MSVLAEINRLGAEQLSIYCRLSAGRVLSMEEEGRLMGRLEVIRRKLASLWDERRGERCGEWKAERVGYAEGNGTGTVVGTCRY